MRRSTWHVVSLHTEALQLRYNLVFAKGYIISYCLATGMKRVAYSHGVTGI